MSNKKLISIVTPCFNEEVNLWHCYEAVRELFETELIDYDYEHIFCDNASTDSSVIIMKRMANHDRRVKVIVNSRNFGPMRSTFNGIKHTSGDAILLLLPADLQDPPELLIDFIKKWEEGYEVVYGIRSNRQENWFMATLRKTYYRLLKNMAHQDIPMNVGSFQLADRVVVDALLQHEDSYPHIPNLIANCGFKRIGIPYTWKKRIGGRSKNRLHHLLDEAINSFISFSYLPMRICMLVGLFIALLSMLRVLYTLFATLFMDVSDIEQGVPTLIVGVFFLSGVQLFFLGVMGEYISSINAQVRKRPMVIERERINFDCQEKVNTSIRSVKNVQTHDATSRTGTL